MRPGFEIPEELLEDYYGGDVGEAEDEETQTEVQKEADSAEEEFLVKENEESEFFDGSDSTSLGQPTGRDDNLTGEVTLSISILSFQQRLNAGDEANK